MPAGSSVFTRPTLLDAAMGTALQARGLPAEALPEEWLVARPQEIAAVHAAHAAAGAQILLTCSFNCTAPRLAVHGLTSQLESFCAAAHRLARVAGGGILIAGDVGPTGLVRPGRTGPSPAELREHFALPFRALRDAGVDLLWTETHYSLTEARAALAEGRCADLPVAVSMVFAESGGSLLSVDGATAEECLRALTIDGAAAVGVNCVPVSAALNALVGAVSDRLGVPFSVKPNAGPPGSPLAPADFGRSMVQLHRRGAWLVGGCCGTTAEHLRAAHDRLRGSDPDA